MLLHFKDEITGIHNDALVSKPSDSVSMQPSERRQPSPIKRTDISAKAECQFRLENEFNDSFMLRGKKNTQAKHAHSASEMAITAQLGGSTDWFTYMCNRRGQRLLLPTCLKVAIDIVSFAQRCLKGSSECSDYECLKDQLHTYALKGMGESSVVHGVMGLTLPNRLS